ncbi:MAG: hypothetical protein RIQ33_1219 [Bacteroidota bacterium]|jgi:GT2 family glycosyltransferase
MISSNPSIAIVILNWNGKHWLEIFLPILIKNTSNNYQIIIGDNASTDDSILFLQQNYPTIKIIKNEINCGFAGGYQQVLKQVDADYYILLNSDVEVTEHWIEPIISYLQNNPTMAAAQPKIKAFHHKDYFEYAGAAGGFIDKNGYMFCRGRLFDTIEIDTKQYDDNMEIFWATGACLFIKSKAFHKVGGFDKLFFAHQEEVDLCWRLKNAGYTIGYCGGSTVYHVGGGMLPKSNPFKTYLNFRNSLFLLVKNIPNNRLITILPYRILLDGVASFKFLSDGNLKDCMAVIKAHISFYASLSVLIKTKKQMKQSGLFVKDSFTKQSTGFYNKGILGQYFFKKHKLFQHLDR